MRKNFDMLRKNRSSEFMRGFSIITSKLKEMYQMITLGGDAELELVDSLDPFSEGINFRSAPSPLLSFLYNKKKSDSGGSLELYLKDRASMTQNLV